MAKFLSLLASSILAQKINKDTGVAQCQAQVKLNPSQQVYFDTTQMSCLPCQGNTQVSEDGKSIPAQNSNVGLSCECLPGYKLNGVQDNVMVPECVACPSGQVSSSDFASCMSCSGGSVQEYLNTDTGRKFKDCTCGDNKYVIEQGTSKSCQSCAAGSFQGPSQVRITG